MTNPVSFKVGLDAARNLLETSAGAFVTLFEHGTLSVELYQPDQVDLQKPHERDEVYIIASGSGKFEVEGEITEVKPATFFLSLQEPRTTFSISPMTSAPGCYFTGLKKENKEG